MKHVKLHRQKVKIQDCTRCIVPTETDEVLHSTISLTCKKETKTHVFNCDFNVSSRSVVDQWLFKVVAEVTEMSDGQHTATI